MDCPAVPVNVYTSTSPKLPMFPAPGVAVVLTKPSVTTSPIWIEKVSVVPAKVVVASTRTAAKANAARVRMAFMAGGIMPDPAGLNMVRNNHTPGDFVEDHAFGPASPHRLTAWWGDAERSRGFWCGLSARLNFHPRPLPPRSLSSYPPLTAGNRSTTVSSVGAQAPSQPSVGMLS